MKEEELKLQRQSGKTLADKREFVMTSSITTGVTVLFIIFGVWAANLVCYHPTIGLDPTTPVSLTVDQ